MEEMELRRQLQEMLATTEKLSTKLAEHNKALDHIVNNTQVSSNDVKN